ncbi:uncharacterized protein LTR77_009550 [Saxophila tyrrhenica]|uniref:WD40 repeat-like protein n=1 Tax=Saxophila tyrrhenica TaxID=1690608 RepID=A0AAV9NXY3_9PEZI|nr:hypothetical protein LTR77_009550 [Saxophila tyrrhenica]
MPVESMSRECFLQEYELDLDQEFELKGKPAAWAPGHGGPRIWGSEDASIALSKDDPDKGNDDTATIALTWDERFLAVATNAVIRIYDVETKQKLAELIGHASNVREMFFSANEAGSYCLTDDHPAHARNAEYLLLSEGSEVGGRDGQMVLWHIDDQGRQIGRQMPFAVQTMADTAIEAIMPELADHHGLVGSDIEPVRGGFVEKLKEADTANRVKDLSVWEGHFPSFGTEPISHDGKSFFYIAHGDSTQSGMRPADELPQLVVVDMVTKTERFRLKGHTDAIMWAGWSPDDTVIATASWDEHYRIWDAKTGACNHTIGPTDGQNWSGRFSPDGKYVCLSGGHPTKVAIYNCATGEDVAKLMKPGLELKDWVRSMVWNPNSREVAVLSDKRVILWKPFEGDVQVVFRLETGDSMLTRFNDLHEVRWVDSGEKLIVQDSEATTFVWDKEKHVKWRFQRPKATELKGGIDVVFAALSQTVITLDGDGMVRFWKV